MTAPHDEATYRAELGAFHERAVTRVGLFNAERDTKHRGYTAETRDLAQAIVDDFAFVDSWAAPEHLAPYADLRKTAHGFLEKFAQSAANFGYAGQRTGEKVIVGGDFNLVTEDRTHYDTAFEGVFISMHLDGGVQVSLNAPIVVEFVRMWTTGLSGSGAADRFTRLSWTGVNLRADYPGGQVEEIAPDGTGRYRVPLLYSPLRILPIPGTAVNRLFREPTAAGAEYLARTEQ